MNVGIDARPLRLQRTGVERMCYHFIESLREVGGPWQYTLFVDGNLPRGPWTRDPYRVVVEEVRHPLLQPIFDAWITIQLPRLMRLHRVDVFFSPHTKFPLSRIPRFTTVHGLESQVLAGGYGLLERIKQWLWLQLCTRGSTGIITFSDHTREDLRRLRRTCNLPICVVAEGVSPMFRVLPEPDRSANLLAALGVRPPYILSVCSHHPRKNLDGLVRAFSLALKNRDLEHQLVLAGRREEGSQDLQSLAARLGIADRLRMPGYVSDDQLVQLYNLASVFVYPSRYEGFGLPVLEAMACGLPVVTSRGSSLEEVAGNAAILVDPDSDRDLASGILTGLLDGAARARLRDAGLERAARFSWTEMTRTICEFISAHVPDSPDGRGPEGRSLRASGRL